MVRAAFSEIENRLVDEIAKAPVKDKELRDYLCLYIQILRQFKQTFETHIQTGELAKIELEQKKSFLRRVISKE